MNVTDHQPAGTGPRRPRMDRDVAMRLAATEYERFLDLLRSLSQDDWTKTTDCPQWDVRAIAGHTTGMALMATGLKETLRQSLVSKRRGGAALDALTALQVEEHAHLTTDELVDRFAAIGPRAARGRRRTPAVVRRMKLPDPQDVAGKIERWTNGYVIDTILTRDPWMHRSDIAQALGRPMEMTPDHDGILVADVVAEWALRHGQPYSLILTGPAGGRWSSGTSGEAISLDAEQFCRILSGRASGSGLMATFVPF
jgi:uncharacterized protein (TIGR03083 family)